MDETDPKYKEYCICRTILRHGYFVEMNLFFSLYATTDAFLYFEALQGASSRVMLAINDKYRPDEAVFLPPQGLLAVTMAKPIM